LNTYFNSLMNNHDENKKTVVGGDDEDDQRTVEEKKWKVKTNANSWNQFSLPIYGIPQSNKWSQNEEKNAWKNVVSLQTELQLANSRVEHMSKKLTYYLEEFHRRHEEDRVTKENLQTEIVELQNQVSCLKDQLKGEVSLMEVIDNLKKDKALISQQHQMQIFLYQEKMKDNSKWENRIMELEEQLNSFKTGLGSNQPRVRSKYFSLHLMPSLMSDDGQEGVPLESGEESKNNLSTETDNRMFASLPNKRADMDLKKEGSPRMQGKKLGTKDLFQNLNVCNTSISPKFLRSGSLDAERTIVNLKFILMEQKIVIKNLENKLAKQEMAVTKAKMEDIIKAKRKRSRSMSTDIGDISKLMSVEGNQKENKRERAITDRELALEQLRTQSALRIKNIKKELMMKDTTRKKEIDRLSKKVEILELKIKNYERQIREFGDKKRYILTLEKEVSQLTSELVNSRNAFQLLRSSKANTVGRLSREIERMRLNSTHFLSLKKGSLPAARRASTSGNMKSSETAREGIVTTLPYFGNV